MAHMLVRMVQNHQATKIFQLQQSMCFPFQWKPMSMCLVWPYVIASWWVYNPLPSFEHVSNGIAFLVSISFVILKSESKLANSKTISILRRITCEYGSKLDCKIVSTTRRGIYWHVPPVNDGVPIPSHDRGSLDCPLESAWQKGCRYQDRGCQRQCEENLFHQSLLLEKFQRRVMNDIPQKQTKDTETKWL